jgi:hypothetical protein
VWRYARQAPAACELPSITGRASLPSTTPAVAAATQPSEPLPIACWASCAPCSPIEPCSIPKNCPPIAQNQLDHWWGVPPCSPSFPRWRLRARFTPGIVHIGLPGSVLRQPKLCICYRTVLLGLWHSELDVSDGAEESEQPERQGFAGCVTSPAVMGPDAATARSGGALVIPKAMPTVKRLTAIPTSSASSNLRRPSRSIRQWRSRSRKNRRRRADERRRGKESGRQACLQGV